jgi:NAD(P)-dependent dehydrogenase (short-subunit alcohol dehydrogenase family)
MTETATDPVGLPEGAVIPTTALVTGANRGLGLEVARQLAGLGTTVFLGSRDPAKGEAAAAGLRAEGGDVRPVELDVTDDASVRAAAVAVAAQVDHLDALVNNAGGNFDFGHPVLGSDVALVAGIIDANCLGAMRCVNAFEGLLRASAHGRIVNVTSEAGSHSGSMGLPTQQNFLAGYAVAKAAQNAYTVKLAAALAGTSILVNAISPGFVATQPGSEDMGARPVPDGAASIVWGATLGDDGPSGGFFRDGEPQGF